MSEQLKKRFDVIELKVAMGDLDQFSCFTQMRTAAMEEVRQLEAELATEKARADAAVGDANEAEAELAEAVELIKQAKPLVDLLFYGGSMDRQSGERVKELFHMFARHGDKS